MVGSDNTSSVSHVSSPSRWARLRAILRLTPKHNAYLEDVAGGLALAVVLWTLYVLVAVLMP